MAGSVLLGAIGPAAAQPTRTRPVEIELSHATALIRDVLSAVNHGNWTGDHLVLRDDADPEFGASDDPTRLAGLTQMRAERLDLLPVMMTDPVILQTDPTPYSQQMQPVWSFVLQPRHVSFDLTFRREFRRGLITGMAVGAFGPMARNEIGR